jgi:hypothetical protein
VKVGKEKKDRRDGMKLPCLYIHYFPLVQSYPSTPHLFQSRIALLRVECL